MSAIDRHKWDERYRLARSKPPSVPSPFMLAVADQLPRTGRCLDVAAGGGRNALWLAQRGLDVTLADVSAEGLALAQERAQLAGVRVTSHLVDLETEPVPAGPWQLIVSILYLNRALLPALAHELAPGGLLLFLQPTTTNLERHPRPPASFLLKPGELAQLLPPELSVVQLTEDWTEDGHHEARLLARKLAGSA